MKNGDKVLIKTNAVHQSTQHSLNNLRGVITDYRSDNEIIVLINNIGSFTFCKDELTELKFPQGSKEVLVKHKGGISIAWRFNGKWHTNQSYTCENMDEKGDWSECLALLEIVDVKKWIEIPEF